MNGNFIQRFFSRFWRMKIRWVESGNTRLLITATVVSKPSIGRRKTQTQLHRCANTVCKFINGKLTPAWHPKPEQGHETVHLPGGRAECQNFIFFWEGLHLHLFRASQSKCSSPLRPQRDRHEKKNQYWKIGKVLPVFKTCLTSTVFVHLQTNHKPFSVLLLSILNV